jgi:riboflavin kinase/FMN adenylyltransferase
LRIQKNKGVFLKVYRDLSADIIKHTVATIGIFDGVHLAHQQIIQRLNELKGKHNTESLLVTLWPHPRYVLNKDADQLKLLSTLEEKVHRLEQSGLDNVLLIPFSKDFAKTPFDLFINQVLVEKLCVQHLVVGFNHHFGKDRQGSYDNLKEYGEKGGFTTERLSKVEVGEEGVSSSKIRDYVWQGNLEKVNNMLGYTFTVSGHVIHGNKVGRELGFPTANIEAPEIYKILPAEGVYAVEADIDGKTYQGMLNIGIRPTVDKRGVKVIEANFFNFTGNLYDKYLTLRFFKRIREEQKFDSLEQLKEQISVDRAEIIEYFKRTK